MSLGRAGLAGAVAAFTLAGCAASPGTAPATAHANASAPSPMAAIQPGQGVALRNPGFEAEPGAGRPCPIQWDCSMHADPTSHRFATDDTTFAAGRRSARVERVKDEPWALVTQTVREPRLRGAKLRFTLAVRVRGASGNGAGPIVLAHGPGGRIIGHSVRLVSGTLDWQPVSVDLVVPVDAELLVVGATLEGPGTLWMDEARLDILEAPSPPKNPV